MGMIGANNFQAFGAGGPDSGEVILWIDKVACRFGVEIPRAHAADD